MATVRNEDALPLAAERQFIVDGQSGGILPHYFMQQLTEISGQYRPDESQDMINDLNALLLRLDYGTDMASVAAAHKATSEEETGYWAGRYALFDSEGTRYWLEMREEGASIDVDGAVIKDYSLVAGLLKLGNTQHAFELQLVPAVSMEVMGQPTFDAQSIINANRARCSGSVTITVDGKVRTLKVEGKCGCFSREGVASAVDGDPAAMWAGHHTLVDTTGKDWKWHDDQLHVAQEGAALTVKLGAVAATNVRFGDNVLQCDFGKAGEKDAARFIGRFSLDVDGSKRMHGAFDKAGDIRSTTGFLTTPATALKHAMKASYVKLGAGQDNTPVLSIDMTAHTDGQEYDLPDGVAGIAYKVKLKLESTPAGAAYTWSIPNDSENVSGKAFTVAPATTAAGVAEPTTGLLTGTPQATFYSFKVVAKDARGVLRSFVFKLRLADKGAMRIVPLDLGTIQGEVELTLPTGVERNRYALLLDPKNIPSTVKQPLQWSLVAPDATYGNIFDIASFSMDEKLGALYGAFGETEHAGHAHITLGLAATGKDLAGKDIDVVLPIKLHIPVESRLPFAPGFTELPPVVRNRHYRVRLSATGGDMPYRWSCGDTSALPNGLKFDPDKAEISGTVSDVRSAQQTIGVDFTISGGDKVIMNSTHVTLFFDMQEPEQVAKEATDWILFVISLAGLGAIAFFFGSTVKKIHDFVKDGVTLDPEKISKEGEGLHNAKFKENFIDYKTKLSTAITVALDPDKNADAKNALETARDLAFHQQSEWTLKRDAMQRDLNTLQTEYDHEDTSLARKAELALEIRELDAKYFLADSKREEAGKRHLELDADVRGNEHENRRRERFHGL
ncbi:MAG: Ig domain-containing protein [Arenimonas sp.]|jgi:hypothetical protein